MKRSLFLLALICAAISSFAINSAAQAVTKTRAVLVGCSGYASPYVSLNATPYRDVDLMAHALVTSGVDEYNAYKDITRSELLTKLKAAFAEADSDDVSYFYFSGHGEIRGGQSTLILTNGQSNTNLTAADLEKALSAIPGTKVLIIDACHAGGFVAKKIGPENPMPKLEEGLAAPFRKAQYKVLAASSVYEYAWSAPTYSDFTFAVAEGLAASRNGRYMADYNANGAVTLAELYDWVYSRNRSSKAQVYPQKDSVFRMANYKKAEEKLPRISNFYGRQVVTSEFIDRPVSIHFTMQISGTVEIVLEEVTPEKGDRQIYKNLARASYPAGKQSYTLTGADVQSLSEGEYALTVAYGYGDDQEAYSYYFHVKKPKPVRIGLTLDREVLHANGVNEMEIKVSYEAPCAITLEIADSNGNRVRRLAIDDEARATHYPDYEELIMSNQYYWDGKNEKGALVSPGIYTVTAFGVGSTRGNTVVKVVLISR